MIVYAIIDLRSSLDHPLGEAVEVFIRREDAESFIEEVRGDDPVLASYLRIEERGLDAGLRTRTAVRIASTPERSRLASWH